MRPVDPRHLPLLAPARAALVAVVSGSVLGGVLVVAQAVAVSALVVAVLDAGGWGTQAARAAWVLLAVTAARAVTAWGVDVAGARAAARVGTALRHQVVAAAVADGSRLRAGHASGSTTLLATRGVAAVEPYLTRYVPTLVLAVALPPLVLVAIAWLDPLSALVVLLTLPLMPVFAVLIGLATRDRADRQWRVLERLGGHFVDVVRGLPTLVANRRAQRQAATVREVTDRYRRATLDTLRLGFLSSAALELVATLSVALVAVTVGLRLAAGSLELGTALTVLLLAPEAYWPIRRVGAEFHAAAEGTATLDRVLEVVEATPPATTAGTPSIEVPLGAAPLRLRGVSVTYPGSRRTVLDGLDLDLPARGLTAVVGPSGCGKSTLLLVLTGQLDPDTGVVEAGGVRLDDDSREVWQSRVAWVPQRPWLLAGSVRENLLLARPDATDEELWAALDAVEMRAVVASLPGGLESVVREDGIGLSAGQRARLALARAVLSQRPLVVLDEPTAHLDDTTEAVVLRVLAELARERSVVVVAHRPAVLGLADDVVELAATPAAPAPATHRPVARPGTGGGPTASPVAPTPRWRRPTMARASLLGALASGAGVALTATAGWLIVKAAEHPPVLTLMVAIVGVRTFGLARPVLRWAERMVSHDVALRELAERRAAVFETLVPLTPGRLTRRRGDLLTSVVEDVDAGVDRQLRVRLPLLTTALVGAGAAAFAAWQAPAAGVLLLLTVALAASGAWGLGRGGVARTERAFVRARADLSALVLQAVQGAADLTLWQAVPRHLGRVDAASRAGAAAALRAAAATGAGRAWVVLACGTGVVLTARVAADALASGAVSGPVLALLVLLPLALVDVVAPLADAGALSVRTDAAERRLSALAEVRPAVDEPASPVPLPVDSDLRADAVEAAWGEGPPAFTGLTLDLPAGAHVGVVGPSGCGKSTLAAVLLRFLDPRRGTVGLAGADLRTLALDDVRRTVGLVDDDPHVFASTLRENLRLARPDSDDDTLLAALTTTHLEPWLAALPDGLDTVLGDGGTQVSGGERARLGLARAVLADSPVLVLDEPTAHLDTATAQAVTDDLLAGAGGERTVVWITHGTVGLDRMDRVVHLGVGGDADLDGAGWGRALHRTRPGLG